MYMIVLITTSFVLFFQDPSCGWLAISWVQTNFLQPHLAQIFILPIIIINYDPPPPPPPFPTPVSAIGCFFKVWGRTVTSWCLACEQALHLGEFARSHARAARKRRCNCKWRRKKGSSFPLSLAAHSRGLSQLASLTINGEFASRLVGAI